MMRDMALKSVLRWTSIALSVALFLTYLGQLFWGMDLMLWFRIEIALFAGTIGCAWLSALGWRGVIHLVASFAVVLLSFILTDRFSVPFSHATFASTAGMEWFGVPVIFMLLQPSICLSSVTLFVTDNEDVYDWIFDASIFATLVMTVVEASLSIERVQRFAHGIWPVFGLPFFHVIGVFIVACVISALIVPFVRHVRDLKAIEGAQTLALITILLSYGVSSIKANLLIPAIISFSLMIFLGLRFASRHQKHPTHS